MYHYTKGGAITSSGSFIAQTPPAAKERKTEFFADYQAALTRAKQVIEEQANRPPESMYLEASQAGA